MVKKIMFRGQISPELDRSVRMLAAIQNKELGQVLTEALLAWLETPSIKELVQKHNLNLILQEEEH